MWSDRYYYINIYHDKSLRVDCKTRELVDFLRSLPELKQTSDFTFSNTDSLPYASLTLLKAYHIDSWSDKETDIEKTNLIAVVCAKSTNEEFKLLKATLIKIAAFLNWQVVDEETDDGIEDFVLWRPQESDRLI